MLTNFLETTRLNQKLGDCTYSLVNIYYFNSTRIKVNKICSDAFCEGKQHVKVNCYNGGKEEYKICNGTPVICIDNINVTIFVQDCSLFWAIWKSLFCLYCLMHSSYLFTLATFAVTHFNSSITCFYLFLSANFLP